MPTITATAQPLTGHVLLTLDWSDVPTVSFVRVLRILSDGSSTVVRAHTFVDPSGDYIELSGGAAVLYDTEAPLDVPISYRMEGLGAGAGDGAMLDFVANDTFTRVVANSWGSMTSGQTYLRDALAADYDVTGTVGTIQPTTLNANYNTWVDVFELNTEQVISFSLNTLPATNTIQYGLDGRFIDSNNGYVGKVSIATTGVITLSITQRLGGVETTLATTTLGVLLAATSYSMRFRVVDTSLKLKFWLTSMGEPGSWDLQVTDTTFTINGTNVGVFMRNNTASTVHILSVDDYTVNAELLTPQVLASGSDLWLKSPLHPWADQRVQLSVPQEPDCIPESAIFFQAMAEETRANRTNVFNVNNRQNPIAAARLRGGITSTLGLITRRFIDRDNVILLNASGDPLMFQGPADYGIPDRYMTVGDYQISRLSTDHRIQWRSHLIPHVEVDRPAGLADGVLGNRWIDLCALYETFGDAQAAGLTWFMVLLGLGSLSPTPTGFRFYFEIPLDFATYGAIPAGGRTYEALFEDR